MIPPLQAVRRILWGNVELEGKKIPVIKRTYPYDKTPCITIDDSGGSTFIKRLITNEEYPLPSNHPQYNPETPFKKQKQQVLREYFQTTLNINVWCNTEDERENLNNTILDLIHSAETDHYMFCNNYHEGDCAYMDNTCFAKHFLNGRSVKKQCPKPRLYGYENIFTTYNIIRASFHIDPPFSLDDLSKNDVILRSVLKIHMGYYTDHIIGGLMSNKIIINKEEVI